MEYATFIGKTAWPVPILYCLLGGAGLCSDYEDTLPYSADDAEFFCVCRDLQVGG